MRHTWLFEAATWQVDGVYADAEGREIDVLGTMTTTHAPDGWIAESQITLPLPHGPVVVRNRAAIVPFPADATQTRWQAEHSLFGVFHGLFTIVDDVILAVYRTADEAFSGVESFKQLDDDHYEANGHALRGTETVLSWRLRLRR